MRTVEDYGWTSRLYSTIVQCRLVCKRIEMVVEMSELRGTKFEKSGSSGSVKEFDRKKIFAISLYDYNLSPGILTCAYYTYMFR